MSRAVPNILSIAGVDPSGGAGILADVKAISALGGFACAVVTALTAQNTRAVTGVLPTTPEFVGEQLDTLLADVRISATKIGMVGRAAVIAKVAERLSHWQVTPIVLDPVMVAKSGDTLLDKSATGALREALVPLATVLTPNLPEAGVLLEARPVETVKEMYRAAERLRVLMHGAGERWVYLKGGHLPGRRSDRPAVRRRSHDRTPGRTRCDAQHAWHWLHAIRRVGDAVGSQAPMSRRPRATPRPT